MLNEFADMMAAMTLSRPAAGSDDSEGNFVPGADVNSTIMAMPVQPVRMGEMLMDEAGRYIKSDVKTYTESELFPGDFLTYRGKRYLVVQVDDRAPLGAHYKAILRAVQDDV